ncbi:unnamed protein product, partial [Closterium sp. Naga37s-1]
TCAKCGANAKCSKDGSGVASCSCNDGFDMLANGTCSDVVCLALGCSPGGTCLKQMGTNVRYCKWDSPCGNCPMGATCKTTPSKAGNPIPYCVCPDGYGMTQDACIEGGKSTVGAASITLIQDPKALDKASRPYTVRANLDGCTDLPKEVAGNYKTRYGVYNMNGTLRCNTFQLWAGSNCSGKLVSAGPLSTVSYCTVFT